MSLFLAQIWIQHANLRHNIQEDHKENLLATTPPTKKDPPCGRSPRSME